MRQWVTMQGPNCNRRPRIVTANNPPQWNQPLGISGDDLLSLGKDGGICEYRKPQRIPDVGTTNHYFGQLQLIYAQLKQRGNDLSAKNAPSKATVSFSLDRAPEVNPAQHQSRFGTHASAIDASVRRAGRKANSCTRRMQSSGVASGACGGCLTTDMDSDICSNPKSPDILRYTQMWEGPGAATPPISGFADKPRESPGSPEAGSTGNPPQWDLGHIGHTGFYAGSQISGIGPVHAKSFGL
ncbi:hypothetical protein BKA70DRAFT_1223079 [Coprinopsis sp. MPI-PUGE-AT-0042]|nr:hypothetical protein BKA70DRAFT_1223079 [Coprinopsis sp. MPI-PUGE-AT-0042]